MIPDFRLQLPAVGNAVLATAGVDPGQVETRLAELKFTCGQNLYKPGVRQRQFERAVDARAGTLMGEYRSKADVMDRLLGAEEGEGRVRRRLDQFGELKGLVSGLFLTRHLKTFTSCWMSWLKAESRKLPCPLD